MKKLLIAAVLLTACFTDEPRTIRTLQSAGFKDITTTGYQAWECGEDDVTSTGFVATNPVGMRVSGTVCCGWGKGCTVRF